MEPLNAVVKKGRLVLDEPTDLPEGQVVVLLPLEELLAAADGFEIVAPPPRSFKRPRGIDAAALIAELKAL